MIDVLIDTWMKIIESMTDAVRHRRASFDAEQVRSKVTCASSKSCNSCFQSQSRKKVYKLPSSLLNPSSSNSFNSQQLQHKTQTHNPQPKIHNPQTTLPNKHSKCNTPSSSPLSQSQPPPPSPRAWPVSPPAPQPASPTTSRTASAMIPMSLVSAVTALSSPMWRSVF
jgi:hypothetical protein